MLGSGVGGIVGSSGHGDTVVALVGALVDEVVGSGLLGVVAGDVGLGLFEPLGMQVPSQSRITQLPLPRLEQSYATVFLQTVQPVHRGSFAKLISFVVSSSVKIISHLGQSSTLEAVAGHSRKTVAKPCSG